MSWWDELYDELLARVLLENVPVEETERTADFIVASLGLRTGDRVMDQGCGLGRLSHALARRGMHVVGIDLSPGYVERARAGGAGLSTEFHLADAFDFTAHPRVRGAFNWWTGFGYADHDDENLRMLRAAFESLEPGGAFLLDFSNFASLIRGFLPSVVDRVPYQGGELVLLRESRIDLAAGVLHKKWTYFVPGDGSHVRETRVRSYMPHELRVLFARAGFVDVEFVGGIDGQALGIDSPRCIVRGRRP
jgi:SAM-dependent methyltransferase